MHLTREQTAILIELMHHAKQHLQYPKVNLQPEESQMKIQISVAGNAAKFPNSLNITDGGKYGTNTWYGRIQTNGNWQPNSKSCSQGILNKVEHELALFADNPTRYATIHGKKYGNCMFCAHELSDPQSVAVGYGPICAENYGLPHGNLEVDIAKELSQIEMEIEKPQPPFVDEDQNFTVPGNMTTEANLLDMPIEHQTAYLLERIKLLEATIYKMQTKGF